MSDRLLALAAVLALLCSGCGTPAPAVSVSPDRSVEVSAPDTSVPAPPVPDASAPAAPPPPTSRPDSAPVEAPPVPDGSAPAEVFAPADIPIPTPEPEPDPPIDEPEVPTVNEPQPQLPSAYDFSRPVAESAPVSTDYFADAAFVGDSRTEGFWLYSGVKQGKLLCATGLTVFSVDSKIMTGGSQTVLAALQGGSFGKIYLAFGLNELGYVDEDSFVQTYCRLIDTIREQHPNAILYIQNLIPVNDAKARASGHKGHVNCDRIRLYNELIARIALEKELPLLDLYSAFAVDGQLPAEASRDGVHPLPAYYKKQLDYLTTHTLTREQLTAPAAPEPPAPEPLPETEVTEI